MSIESKVQSLITASNAKTGETDTNLTAAVQRLIDGFGQGGGTATINGAPFDCGTFTLETDQTANFTVQHNLGMMPVAGFMWVVNPPLKDEDGSNLQYQYGKIRTVNLSDSNNASYGKFGAMLYVAGGEYSAVKGSTYEAGNFRWTAETVTFCCSSTYPLRAGLKYQWLLIGGADA